MTEDTDLITEIEAARMRCQSVRTLQMERLRGSGCRYVKMGRSVRYRRSDVLAFIASRVVSSTTEADALQVAHG
ncbi:DNA-binding protein [Bradyrhizobium sp. Ash2021]|uniref:helix-turn-helix transcriptional regulator n=1 Tax=Bradyrhizobium sp. Ash2021 TaxID=2954771 RepID=UPI002814D352|nr:DNA-binding protein [Bradyrhizobium sp. Ash2021]WMT73937.1 DNA-binding protein [Bradyrhizobium sp. Ash2021]